MDDKNSYILEKIRFLSDTKLLAWYPPFWFMRPKVIEKSDDYRHIRVVLPLTWATKNAAGNMFGGSQSSLADPIPAFMCVKNFPGYRVATKKLELEFLRVGNSDLTLHFDVSDAKIAQIKQELEENNRSTPCFEMSYVRKDGHICTKIRNTVAIRPIGYVGRHENKQENVEKSADNHV